MIIIKSEIVGKPEKELINTFEYLYYDNEVLQIWSFDLNDGYFFCKNRHQFKIHTHIDNVEFFSDSSKADELKKFIKENPEYLI